MPSPPMLFVAPAPPGGDALTSLLLDLWEERGLGVQLLGLDPQAAPHTHDDALLGASPRDRVLAGFSLGARRLATLGDRLGARGLALLGFPFHDRHDPSARSGLAALSALTTPSLVVQGTRDPHGTREQVHSYGPLPPCVRVHWVDDGNHRFIPRARSGVSTEQQVAGVADVVAQFARQVA